MTEITLTKPRTWSPKQQQRAVLFAVLLVEIVILIIVANFILGIEAVEDYRETVGDQEIIYLKNEVTGDPILLVFVIAGWLLPLFSRRLRQEIIVLVFVQAIIVSLIMFVFWPLAQVLVEGFKAGQDTAGFTLDQFRFLAQSATVARATRNTLFLGVTTATLATILGLFMAYTLTLTDVPYKRWVRILVVLPLVSPPFALSFAIILMFGRRGLVTHDLLGITQYDVYGPQGVIFVQLIHSIPLIVLILSAVLASINRDLEDAAEDLGGKPLYVLRTVTFPLITPAILTAWLLTFIASISDFGNPFLIGGGFQVLATQMFIQMIEFFDLQRGAALAIPLVMLALLAFLIQHYISNRRSYITVTSGAHTGVIRNVPGWIKWPLYAVCLLFSLLTILLYGSIFVGSAVQAWGFDYSITLDNYKGLLTAIPQLRNSLSVSVSAGFLGGALAIVLAWIVTRPYLRGRSALDFSGTLMYAIPGTVVGIGFLIAFNGPPYLWTGFTLILVAYIFRRLPVGLRTGVSAQRQIDPSLEEASLDLGATRARTFRSITLPLLSKAFFAGVIYIFIRSMTDLSAAIFLSTGRFQLYTVRMFNVMIRSTPSEAAAFAALLIVIILISLGLLSRVTGKSFVDLFRIG